MWELRETLLWQTELKKKKKKQTNNWGDYSRKGKYWHRGGHKHICIGKSHSSNFTDHCHCHSIMCPSWDKLCRNQPWTENPSSWSLQYFGHLMWRLMTLATLTHLKRPWYWERLKVRGEGDDRGWDGWMASLTPWTTSGSWWWTGKPGMLQSMGSQRVRHNWVTELNWTVLYSRNLLFIYFIYSRWLILNS